jgi:hypothetical protein
MEHLVRVQNERDRRTLAWLRERVGDASIAAAVEAFERGGLLLAHGVGVLHQIVKRDPPVCSHQSALDAINATTANLAPAAATTGFSRSGDGKKMARTFADPSFLAEHRRAASLPPAPPVPRLRPRAVNTGRVYMLVSAPAPGGVFISVPRPRALASRGRSGQPVSAGWWPAIARRSRWARAGAVR